MIKTAINPWQWQSERNYAQAIEIKMFKVLYAALVK